MNTESLQATDDAAAANQRTPNRVTLPSIKDKIASVSYIHPSEAPHMTLAVVKMSNGFIVIGKTAPADPGNFDEELGRKFAFEDAVRQIWPLEGYLLRDRLHTQATAQEPEPGTAAADSDPATTSAA